MSDLARNTGVNVASMHAVLAVLADEGYVMRDPAQKTYRLGLSPIAIGHAALKRHPMIDHLREETADLAERLGVECVATVTAGGELLFVAEAGATSASTSAPGWASGCRSCRRSGRWRPGRRGR